jgi:hypothetical protein
MEVVYVSLFLFWSKALENFIAIKYYSLLMRVNSINVLDEGLRIGEIGRRMNSKVKSVKQGVY